MKLLTPHAVYTSPPDTGLTVPAGRFAQVAHDWQREEMDYLPRQLRPDWERDIVPVPSTCPLHGVMDDFMPLSREWQFFIYDLLDFVTAGNLPREALLRAYISLTEDHKVFTDGHARENGYADFVTWTNLQAKPYEWKSLACTGNLVKILDTFGQFFVIETLDVTKTPARVADVIARPWLIHWATEQGIDRLPGKEPRYTVARFPQLKVELRRLGLEEMGTPYPLLGIGGVNLIEKSRVFRIGGGYSVYAPEK